MIDIKWIIGYVDSYDAVHYKVVAKNDPVDSHNQVWPGPKQRKWRWSPDKPFHLNSYDYDFSIEHEEAIWNIIDKFL